MTVVKRVTKKEMVEKTGIDTLGYAKPQISTIFIRKNLPKKVEKEVLQHEYDHITKGEEGPFWGAIAGAAISYLAAKKQAKATENAARIGADAADPFSGQRDYYQGLLRNLYGQDDTAASDKFGFIRNLPSYQFAQQEAMRGVTRTKAAQGLLRSGNLLTSLQERSAGLASQTYESEVNRLMTLAGATVGSPGTAGQIGYAGGKAAAGYNQQAYGALGYGITRALGSNNNSSGQASYGGYNYGTYTNTDRGPVISRENFNWDY